MSALAPCVTTTHDRLEVDQIIAIRHLFPGREPKSTHNASRWSVDHMLHLHCLDHHECSALLHGLAGRDA